MSQNEQAFEYVVGSLRGDERDEFEQALSQNQSLRAEVAFWEERLLALNPNEDRAPDSKTWQKIESTIAAKQPAKKPWYTYLTDFSHWDFPVAATAVLFVAVLLTAVLSTQLIKPSVIQPNYVAVLTDTEGQAIVTALSYKGEETTMSLQWQHAQFNNADRHLQLWAVSKRDGQARSLAVIADPKKQELPLDQALWRLVTDADYLILTEEEPGGSAIDEPSEDIIAKGICVQLS